MDDDYFDYIKRIGIIKVSKDTLIDIKTNKIMIDDELVKQIKNTCEIYTNKSTKFVEYACLFCSNSLVLAVEFNYKGISIMKSDLLIDEALDIIEVCKKMKPINLNYKIINKEEYNNLITRKEEEMINKLYSEIPSISVDYGIMERSNEVVVIPGDFGWNDLGSWDVLGSIYPTDDEGNIKRGENIVLDTRDSIIYSDQKIITTVGVKDLIIVSTEDSVMVCPKDRAQDVKYIVEKLKEEEKHVYL